MVMGLAVAVGAAAAVGALVPAALVGSTAAAIFPYAGMVAYTTGVAGMGFGAAALATVVGIIIVAVVIAVMQGMIVINAAELPGQLAELIVDARTDAPDVDELIDTTDGMTTLMALFVLATLPEPRDEYCDNSSTIPDNIKHGGVFVNLSWIPCLNRTGIPEATPYDPRFLIKEDGETTGTLSPTITFQDHAATTATARLHDGWFILEPTGSYDEQTLAIEYIDWNGKKQRAWLLGNPDASQVFVSLDVTNDLTEGLEDCLDDGLCSESESLEYLSPDGKKMSATVEQWKPAVGAPSYDATPVELSPTSYDANGFAPTDATGEVSYEWRFETAPCTKPCVLLKGPLAPPDYGDPVSGAEVTHTWPYSGALHGCPHGDRRRGADGDDQLRGSGGERAATDPGARSRLPAERGRQPGAWAGVPVPDGIHGDPAEAPGFIRRRAVRLAGEHQLGGRQRRGRLHSRRRDRTAPPLPRLSRDPGQRSRVEAHRSR